MEGLSYNFESKLRISSSSSTASVDGTNCQNKNLLSHNLQLETMTKALRQLGQFLQPALTFLNCHFTDYYLRSYWETLVPPKLRQDLEAKSIDQVKACMIDLTTGKWKSYPEASSNQFQNEWNFNNVSTLEQLIVSVGKLKLSELQLCTSYQDYQKRRDSLKEDFPKLFVDLEFDTFMSSKKMHEVFKFSEFIACACDGVNISNHFFPNNESPQGRNVPVGPTVRNIVDVGSGKGYLSSFLSLYYDLRVLAIDASATNTEGCEKRLEKLDRTWPQLVRRAKERQIHGTCTSMGKNWRKKVAKMGITVEEYRKTLMEQANSGGEGDLKSITEMITTKTDLQRLVDANFDKECDNGKNQFGIIGLHTCGNLGANILKLFVHNKSAKFICVVPCCYNLVREDESLYPEDVFYGSKYGNEVDGVGGKSAPWPDGSIGFPLSNELNNFSNGKPFVMGRNARMLSAYSLPRMIQGESGLDMPPVLYYRGMLQVLFKQYGLLPSDYCIKPQANNEDCDIRVGRMTKKCTTFRDYVTFALRKINREVPSNILSDTSIEEIEATYASPEMLAKFHKYYLLRAVYASVLEDLILLDRMVYLLEQESVADASLVQLFDPALSPRSHAIVAVKKS